MSFMEKTRYEMEHEEELLAAKLAELKEIRQKKQEGILKAWGNYGKSNI